jgi:alkaline phosphatase
MKRVVFYLAIAIFFMGCASTPKEPKAKYVFLFIGDGMGLAQIQAAELYKAAVNEQTDKGGEKLNFSKFPVQGLVTTHSANNSITCSSAAGTAISTGVKTKNGIVSLDVDSVKVETIAENIKKQGYKVGILSSVAIDHATPAVFYAHHKSRSAYYEISTQLADNKFDYFGGGGFHYPTGKKNNKKNAFEMAKEAGYTIVNSKEAFGLLANGAEKVFAMNPELYPQGEFYWSIDKKEGALSLADFTRKGIELLTNEKGFFMMVEGGKIDWAGHGNDAASNIHETLAFEEAIAEALDFYKQHPDETLIIVTADHETGGLGIGNNAGTKHLDLSVLAYQKISSQEFERKLIGLKTAEKKTTFKELMEMVSADFGLNNGEVKMQITQEQERWLKQAYEKEFNGKEVVDPDRDYMAYSSEKNFTERVVYLLDQKAGLGWTTTNHTGIPVPIKTIGAGQSFFGGMFDNTDISKKIKLAMGI